MVNAMATSKVLNKSFYLLSAVLIVACQPPSPTDEPLTAADSASIDNSLIITDDSVTMTPDHLLSIKPTRYQPSLGLQGNIEPIKKIKLITAHPATVEEILVSKGQWVAKGAPLFIVRRLNAASQTTDPSNTTDEPSSEINAAAQGNLSADDTNNAKQQDIPKDTAKIKTTSKPSQPKSNDKIIEKNAHADSKEPSTTSDIDNADRATNTKPQYNLTTVYASFSGRIEGLYATTGQKLEARSPIVQLSDETKLHFTATLPIQAKSQLSVGQTVNFTAEETLDKFTGQVSKLTTTTEPKRLLVSVNAIENQLSRDKLLPNMKVTGRVNYGQIEVGVIVPKRALHDVDLTELHSPPYKPLRALTANVWIIEQDQRLTLQPIEVIEFDPSTNQYLISGISNDSLICLADLPIDSKGKKVIVS